MNFSFFFKINQNLIVINQNMNALYKYTNLQGRSQCSD